MFRVIGKRRYYLKVYGMFQSRSHWCVLNNCERTQRWSMPTHRLPGEKERKREGGGSFNFSAQFSFKEN